MSRRLLELGSAAIAQCRLQALMIVLDLDEFEDGGLRLDFGCKEMVSTLSFQGSVKALHHGVILTITVTPHTHLTVG